MALFGQVRGAAEGAKSLRCLWQEVTLTIRHPPYAVKFQGDNIFSPPFSAPLTRQSVWGMGG